MTSKQGGDSGEVPMGGKKQKDPDAVTGSTKNKPAPKVKEQSGHSAGAIAMNDVRIPGFVGIGPVMKLSDVLATKSSDPAPDYMDEMYEPSAAELVDHLSKRLREEGGMPMAKGRDGEMKQVFGPERPPAKGKEE